LTTGRIVGDQKEPRIGGIELSDAVVSYNEGAADSVQLEIPEFSIGAIVPGSEVPVGGKINAVLADPAIAVAATLSARAAVDGPRTSLTDLELALVMEGETVPEGKQSGVFRIKRLELDQDAQTMAVEGVALDMAGLRIKGNAKGERMADAPAIEGRLTVGEFSPRELMETFDLEIPVTADPAVLGKASLETLFSSNDKQIALSSLRMQLDDTLIAGNLSATTGESMLIKGKIHVDDIDLDRYMAPESDATSAKSEGTDIPTEDLRARNVDATLTMGSVKAAGLRLSNVKARLVLERGSLRVAPMTADFYDGKLAGSFLLTTSEQLPRMSLKQTVSGVNVASLLRDLAEVDLMTGTAGLDIDVSATGATSDQMISDLDGLIGFDVQDGVLRRINITWELQRALALIKRRSVPERGSDETAFRNISGRGVISNGILRNDDLVIAAPGLELTGAGAVDLNKESVDYNLIAEVPKGPHATEAGLDDLVGKRIPVKISGSLDDPSVRLDLGKLIGAEVGDFLIKQLGLGKDKDKGKGEEGGVDEEKDDGNILEDALKDLFGQ
jgi:AsmA protein